MMTEEEFNIKQRELTLEEMKLSSIYQKDQLKRERIGTLLNVIECLGKNFISDMKIKSDASNLTTKVLISELEKY